MRKTFSEWILITTLLTFVFSMTAVASTVNVSFLLHGELVSVTRNASEKMLPAEAAVRALIAGPTDTESAIGYVSRIPKGVSIKRLFVLNDSIDVDMSSEVLRGIDEYGVQTMFDQFRSTLDEFRSIKSIRLTSNNKLLSSYLPTSPEIGVAACIQPQSQAFTSNGTGLSGHSITIGPSHGMCWYTSWGWQRSDPCGLGEAVLEDTNSIRLTQFLSTYLKSDGATVECVRQLDESDGYNTQANQPWWKMAAFAWLHHIGVPSTVWANWSGNNGDDQAVNRANDDIRCRPLYADYKGTDIYIACHTNAGGGTGTETYWDSKMEHPVWVNQSNNLATQVQNNVCTAIREMYDANWYVGRGTKDANGGYGEIRIPNRPACLIELAFHDNCSKDAQYLTDDFFRSVAEWGLYKGVCSYFGSTPTWDKYSCEYLDDTIPTVMTTGRSYTVTITLRNRGVCWFTSRGFRLGTPGGGDPFTTFNRIDTPGEIKPGQTCTYSFTMIAPQAPGIYSTQWQMVRDGYQWFGPIVTKSIDVLTDDPRPTIPRNLRVERSKLNSLTIAWDPSSDDQGIAGYQIYRDGSMIGSTTATSYTDNNLTENHEYSYQVRAFDLTPNYSELSDILKATTATHIFSDGFDGSISNWQQDVGSLLPLDYSTVKNHGMLAGLGSAHGKPNIDQYVIRLLDQSSLTYTNGGYKSGTCSAWFYDSLGSGGDMYTGIGLSAYNNEGFVTAIYWVGISDSAFPVPSSHYMAMVLGSSFQCYDLGPRSLGWHRLIIENEAQPTSNLLSFSVDDGTSVVVIQPAFGSRECLRCFHLGCSSNTSSDYYIDDVIFDSSPPAAPSGLTATNTTTNSIKWLFQDNAYNEIGFRLYDSAVTLQDAQDENKSYITEAGLKPNTLYTRKVKAYAGSLESLSSNEVSECTFALQPSVGDVTCSNEVSSWISSNLIEFVPKLVFGPGTLEYYKYSWNQSTSYLWSGQEPQWRSGNLQIIASASRNPWYLYLQSHNAAGISNGTLVMGPYLIDNTHPVCPQVKDNGYTTALPDTLQAEWTSSDDESGIKQYQYAIGTTPYASNIVDWTTPSPQDAKVLVRSGLELVEGQTYYVSVKAQNSAGLWSNISCSDGIKFNQNIVTITKAKELPDDSALTISNCTISAAFSGCFYIQDQNILSGIKVLTDTTVTEGNRLKIIGTMKTSDGERYIQADRITVN